MKFLLYLKNRDDADFELCETKFVDVRDNIGNIAYEETIYVPSNDNNIKYIVDNCNVEIGYTKDLLPVYDKDIDEYEYLCNLCNKGLKRRLNNSKYVHYENAYHGFLNNPLERKHTNMLIKEINQE